MVKAIWTFQTPHYFTPSKQLNFKNNLIIYITINIKSKHFNPDICRVDSLFSDGLKSKSQKNKENIFRFKNQPMPPFKQTIKPSRHILD